MANMTRFAWVLAAALLPSVASAQANYFDDDKIALGAIQGRISDAIQSGCEWLIRHQNRDGSWSAHFGWHPSHIGISGLATYTLIKSNKGLDHPAVRRGILFLESVSPNAGGPSGGDGGTTTFRPAPPGAKAEVDRTYDATCMLMAFGAACEAAEKEKKPGEIRRFKDSAKKVLDELLPMQCKDGNWGYNKGSRYDISNTQYAALGLRAAEHMGLPVDPKIYDALYKGVIINQPKIEKVKVSDTVKEQYAAYYARLAAKGGKAGGKSGGGTTTTKEFKVPDMPVSGFFYRADGEEAKETGSRTCGGATVVAMCRMYNKGFKLTKEAEERELSAINWLIDHWKVDGDPEGNWHYYYLYGLERVGSILEIDYIGNHPWYLEGAKYIIDHQGGGGWGNEENTCFAVLFLKQATKRIGTGNTKGDMVKGGGGGIKRYLSDGADSEVHLLGVGEGTMELSISGFPEAVKAVYGKGFKVEKVEYLINGKVEKEVKPKRVWKPGDGYAVKVEFGGRGTYKVTAKVYVSSAEANGGAEEKPLEAKGFEVKIDNVFAAWMERAAMARRLNLLHGMKLKSVKASSTEMVESDKTKDGTDAFRAFDDKQYTYWQPKADDKENWIEVVLDKGVTAKTIAIGQLNRRIVDINGFDKIKKVEISINGAVAMTADLDLDDLKTTFVELPRAVGIQSLKIKVLERERGGSAAGRLGFTEIGLEAR